MTCSPIEAIPASAAGALAGFESRCDCGLVIRSSLRSIIEADVREHLAWHAGRETGPRWTRLSQAKDLTGAIR